MLHYIRSDIVEHNDEMYTQKRLLKYPPVEDIHVLVTLAINYLNDKAPTVKKIESESKAQQQQQQSLGDKLSGLVFVCTS